MLKKAGILVAATAAGLLAVSPLAFAGDKDDHYGYGGSEGGTEITQIDDGDQTNVVDGDDRESNQFGLVNTGDINALNDVNVCPSVPVAAGIGANILGILGSASGEADADADDTTCVNDDSINQGNFDD